MSDGAKKVVCKQHGETPPAFACRHLAFGVACGYHASGADPDAPWPDAWCDRCDAAYDREGGWNEASEAEADVKLLCTHCYERSRALNRDVPAPLRRGQLASDEDDWAALVRAAHAHVRELQVRAQDRFDLGHHDAWSADYDAGRFTFGSKKRVEVVADLQIVGSYSLTGRSWMWGWANDKVKPPLVEDVARLRVLGEVRGMPWLTERLHADVDDVHAWELTQVACYLLGHESVYRAPMDSRYLFVLLRNLRRVS